MAGSSINKSTIDPQSRSSVPRRMPRAVAFGIVTQSSRVLDALFHEFFIHGIFLINSKGIRYLQAIYF